MAKKRELKKADSLVKQAEALPVEKRAARRNWWTGNGSKDTYEPRSPEVREKILRKNRRGRTLY